MLFVAKFLHSLYIILPKQNSLYILLRQRTLEVLTREDARTSQGASLRCTDSPARGTGTSRDCLRTKLALNRQYLCPKCRNPNAAREKPRGPSIAEHVTYTPPAPVTKPAFSQVLTGVKFGILTSNYPEELLSTEQLSAVQKTIRDRIVDLEDGTVNPKFNSVHNRPGWLALMFANRDTAEWLKGCIKTIKP